MEQMKIDPAMLVEVDYEDPTLHPAIKELKPIIFKEEGDFCCLLGPDPTVGIFGCGHTPEEAEEDWLKTLNSRLSKSPESDEVVAEIKDMLSVSKNDVW